MGAIPNKVQDKIQYAENHITPWTDNAMAIGTSTLAVSDLNTKTEAARTAFDNQKAAQQSAKAATNQLQVAVDAMVTATADIIKSIRTKAAVVGDSVYTLAEVDAPLPPSPVNELGTPTDFKATLNPDGTLVLGWKCSNPRGATGTTYNVFRRVGSEGEFDYLGGSGGKMFVDSTVPSGAAQLQYQIQAVRSTAVGNFANFVVNFGVGAEGAVVASVDTTGATKKAA